jgi:hypothetical protein
MTGIPDRPPLVMEWSVAGGLELADDGVALSSRTLVEQCAVPLAWKLTRAREAPSASPLPPSVPSTPTMSVPRIVAFRCVIRRGLEPNSDHRRWFRPPRR